MSTTHKIDQIHWGGRFLIATPRDMLVGTHKRELAGVQFGRFGIINVKHEKRHTPLGRCGHQATYRHVWGKPDQTIALAQRIIKRAAVTQPEMRRTASRHGRRREAAHRIVRVRLAVISDDW